MVMGPGILHQAQNCLATTNVSEWSIKLYMEFKVCKVGAWVPCWTNGRCRDVCDMVYSWCMHRQHTTHLHLCLAILPSV
jgi:hypothetical protein